MVAGDTARWVADSNGGLDRRAFYWDPQLCDKRL